MKYKTGTERLQKILVISLKKGGEYTVIRRLFLLSYRYLIYSFLSNQCFIKKLKRRREGGGKALYKTAPYFFLMFA